MNQKPSEREAERMQAHREELIERLRRDFDQPLRIEQLARELGMSVSGLHHHFKAVTTMNPSQFQKRLRCWRLGV